MTNEFIHPLIQPLQFFATAPYPCSYLSEHTARAQVAVSSENIDTQTYTSLVASGFRRSGNYAYRPYCDQCQSCIPLRLSVNDFKPNRSQQRVMRKNASLRVYECDLTFSQAQFELYEKYQNQRHAGGGMDQPTRQDYTANILQSPFCTRMIEFRELLQDGNEVLRMVAVVDFLDDGLSAVYTFYDPAVNHRSYGTYAILWQIQRALLSHLPYVYLGYWIEESPKMRYKSLFKPYEILRHGKWHKSQ